MEIALGLVVIAVGIWYFFFRDKEVLKEVSNPTPVENSTSIDNATVVENVFKPEENKSVEVAPVNSAAIPLAIADHIAEPKNKKSANAKKPMDRTKSEKPKTSKAKKPPMKVIK